MNIINVIERNFEVPAARDTLSKSAQEENVEKIDSSEERGSVHEAKDLGDGYLED